jgi:tryptophanyl-tRNA synthetase
LVGIDGKAKASKSLGNAIFLSDEPETIKQKVFQMFTDPNHIRVSDPGRVEGNVVFSYLDAFFEDKEELASLKEHYSRGGLGDTTIKNILNQTLQTLLEPIRTKRLSLTKNDVAHVLHEGTQKARQRAQETMEQVRDLMGLRYDL